MGNCQDKCKTADGGMDSTAVVAAIDEKYASAVATAAPVAAKAQEKANELIVMLSPRAQAAKEAAMAAAMEAGQKVVDMISPRGKKIEDDEEPSAPPAAAVGATGEPDPETKPAAEAAQPEATSGLSVEFKDAKGQTRTIVFEKKPLGMTFAEHHSGCCDGSGTTLTVAKVPAGGYAFTLGVMPGWQFVKLNGEQIPEGLPYDTFGQKLKEAVTAANLEGYTRTSLTKK
jgi:hypothetical protein